MYKSSNDIYLRKVSVEDLPKLMWLKNTTWMHTHHTVFLNMADQTKWFDKVNSDPTFLFLIASLNTQGDIGTFKIDSIDAINRSCNVGWDVFEESRGKGFGKKVVAAGVEFCFQILNLRRLTAEILVTNEASIKCAVSAGFVEEGCKKQAVYKLGQYIDSKLYGIVNYA